MELKCDERVRKCRTVIDTVETWACIITKCFVRNTSASSYSSYNLMNQLCGWKQLVGERGQRTGCSWLEGDSNSNNHSLQLWWTERFLRMNKCQTWRWISYNSRNQVWFWSCQTRTETWECSGHRSTRTGELKMVRAGFGVNRMNPWTQPVWCRQSKPVVGV